MQYLKLWHDLMSRVEKIAGDNGALSASVITVLHDDHLHILVEFDDALGASHNIVCGLGVDIITSVVDDASYAALVNDLETTLPAMILDNLAQAAAKLAAARGQKLPVVLLPQAGKGH